MSSSVIEVRPALAQRVETSKDTLIVDLTDGRSLTVPLAWYPRLALGTTAELAKWRLIGRTSMKTSARRACWRAGHRARGKPHSRIG